MQLQQEKSSHPFYIKHYEPGKIEVKDGCYHASIIISPTEIIRWENPELAKLSVEDFVANSPGILLVGTGKTMQFLNPSIVVEFQKKAIGIEVMTTAAACRTFNVLLSESRDVMAALII